MTTDRDAGGPLVAFAYDFDGTLAPGNMQDHAFIPGELGMERKAFWDEVGELAREQRGDNILAYMNLMLAKAAAKDVPLSHDAWRRRGADLPLFPGVTGWFERQNARARALGLELCHFIISSGNRELIEGSPIGHHFRRIYAYIFPSTNGSATLIRPNATADYQEERQWWSNEITLVSTHEGPLQWILGAFQYREDYEQPFYIYSDQPEVRTPYYSGFCGFYNTGLCAILGTPPVLAPAQPDGAVYLVNTQGEGTSYALFAQVDYDITQTLHVTAGIRHTWDTKDVLESERLICFGVVAFGCPALNGDYSLFGLGVLAPAPVIAADLTPATSPAAPGATAGARDPISGQLRRNLGGEWSAFTGTLGLQWEPTEDTLAYFRYSRGYKAGGFNTGATAPFAANPRVDEETVDAFEIGLKQEFGTFLTVNISAFFYNYQDAQAPFTVVPPVGPAFGQFINIPESHNTGIEIETTWRPIENLQILANYSYLSAEIQDGGACYTDSLDPTATLPSAQPAGCVGGGQRIEGRQLPAVTPHKVALNANYTWDLEPGYVVASVSWIWKDRTPYSFFGNPNTYAPSYSSTDVRLSFASRGGHYTITAYGRNIFDQEGYEGAGGTRQTNGLVFRNFTITPPRTYGVELQYRF